MTHCNNRMMKVNATKFMNGHGLPSLYHAYSNPSGAKDEAMTYCKKLAHDMCSVNGEVRIMSYNTFNFTAGFIGMHPEDGRAVFVYITRDNDRYIYLDELED